MKRSMSVLLVICLTAAPLVGAAANKPGQALFARHCSHCHAPGIDHPGTLMLSVKRGEAYAVLEERNDLSVDYIKYIVRQGQKTMPAFKPTTLSNGELDALASYLCK